jgi:hypothetical protein
MAAWPGEEIEQRASDIADAANQLLRHPAAWRHRRVETLTMLSHEQVRRHVSVDFTVPHDRREGLQLSDAGEYAVPLAFVAKRPLVHFDLRNEESHAIPLLTAEQNTLIARELLYQQLETDLAAQDADEAKQDAVTDAAGSVIEATLGDLDTTGAVERLERAHELEPLTDFRTLVDALTRNFLLWAVVRGLERRRIFKFAYDEPFAQRPGLAYVYDAPGCAEAWSYHVEVEVPVDLKARTTRLHDAATGEVLVTGAVNADRPALYLSPDPANLPLRPEVVVDYGAERSRFLGPAAIVATVIALLITLPWLFSDLTRLGSAGPAIALVLSTSAVFSALVLRTDEHPLLRLILVRDRLCLVATTLIALFAAALLGFQADAALLNAGWAVAAVVSAVASGILITSVVRAPSMRSTPAPEQP